MPSTPYDAKGLLKAAIRSDNPVVFIEHKATYGQMGAVPEGDYIIPLGVADIKRPGKDVTIVTYSRQTMFCLDAAKDPGRKARHRRRGHRPADHQAHGHRHRRRIGPQDRPAGHRRRKLQHVRHGPRSSAGSSSTSTTTDGPALTTSTRRP
jgi:hypothetical protein